jgi:transposase
MTTRRSFTTEFKLAAVKKIVEQGMSYAEVARDLGIRDQLLRQWKMKFEASGELAAATSHGVEAELKRLREENRQLKMEREILKKATAFFVKEKN